MASCENKSTTTTDTDTPTTTTEETGATAATVAPDSATAMNNWMAYMTPGEEHKMLASWDGTWTGESTMWEAPDKEPQKATLTTINKMILGGRYQHSTNSGNMMGQPFEGISTTAYDNDIKEFISTWIDNFGTGLMTMTGKWDSATKSLEFKGKMVDPTAGNGTEKTCRQVITVIDNDHQKMEMYCNAADGKEFKNMEIISTRK